MPEPLNNLDYTIGCEVLFVSTFAGHDVTEDILRGRTPHDQALDECARGPRGLQLGLAGLIFCIIELFSRLHLVALDEEIVQPDYGDCRPCGAEMRISTTAAEYTPSAPSAERDV